MLGEDVEDPSLEGLPIVDHAGRGDPDRGVLAGRLDDQGEGKVEVPKLRRLPDHRALGDGDTQAPQDLPGLRLVEGEGKGDRRAAGVGDPQGVEDRRDRQLASRIAGQRLAEVEDHVRPSRLEFVGEGEALAPAREELHLEAGPAAQGRRHRLGDPLDLGTGLEARIEGVRFAVAEIAVVEDDDLHGRRRDGGGARMPRLLAKSRPKS